MIRLKILQGSVAVALKFCADGASSGYNWGSGFGGGSGYSDGSGHGSNYGAGDGNGYGSDCGYGDGDGYGEEENNGLEELCPSTNMSARAADIASSG